MIQVSMTRLIGILGVAKNDFNDLLDDGLSQHLCDKKFDLHGAVNWFVQYLIDRDLNPDGEDLDLDAQKKRKEAALARKAKRKAEALTGGLSTEEQVIEALDELELVFDSIIKDIVDRSEVLVDLTEQQMIVESKGFIHEILTGYGDNA